jgi:hypothetical protein
MQLIVAITLVNLTFKLIKQPLVSPTRKYCTTKEPILFTGSQVCFASTVKNTGVCEMLSWLILDGRCNLNVVSYQGRTYH